MSFEVHMLQENLNKEKVEVIEYGQTSPKGDKIWHVVEVNIQRLATGETGSQVRKMSFVFGDKEQATFFQQAIMVAESVI